MAKEIRRKSAKFITNPKEFNVLPELLMVFQEEHPSTIITCIKELSKVFCLLAERGDLQGVLQDTHDNVQNSETAHEEQYKKSLSTCYPMYMDRLIELLSHHADIIQELSLGAFLRQIQMECLNPIAQYNTKEVPFPQRLTSVLIKQLLSSTHLLEEMISRLSEYLQYHDLRYYVMKAAADELAQHQGEQLTAAFQQNFLTLLENLTMPADAKLTEKLTETLCQIPENEKYVSSLKEQRKLYSSLWMKFLGHQLSNSTYKKILVILHDHVMPHLSSPLMLADFLTQCLDLGGAIGLLALNGIFVLMQNYNLEYPDFYTRLYALLEAGVLHVKYRARFLFLLDLFLTSTHLAAYIVGAFAKKLSRLCLTAPPDALVIVLPMIYNLLRRHPAIMVLLHRLDMSTLTLTAAPSQATMDMSSDPFDITEPDLSKCNALNSSLWEVQTLQNHYHHTIALLAKKIDYTLSKESTSLDSLLETSIADLYEKETKKKMGEVPCTFEPPSGLCGNNDDRFSTLWIME